jgi:osmotically-inducible protein OsmY
VLSVPGVRGIGSEVKSPDLVAEMLGVPGQGDDAGNRNLSGAAADLWITVATKLRLLADPQVPGMEVDVDAWNGVVTLFGSVPTREAMEAAVEAARSTKGVERVENDILVIPEQDREATRARDEFLAKEVKRALNEAEPPKGAIIRVKANAGVVRLTGTVPSESTSPGLVAAHATPGVRGGGRPAREPERWK